MKTWCISTKIAHPACPGTPQPNPHPGLTASSPALKDSALLLPEWSSKLPGGRSFSKLLLPEPFQLASGCRTGLRLPLARRLPNWPQAALGAPEGA